MKKKAYFTITFLVHLIAISLLLLAATSCATKQLTEVHPASYLQSHFGSSMDSTDHAQAHSVLEGGSEGRPVSWQNPTTRKHFAVTPIRTFKSRGMDCRDYVATYENRSVSGSACRLENGTWINK